MGMTFLLTAQYTGVEIFQKVWMPKFCTSFNIINFLLKPKKSSTKLGSFGSKYLN